LAAEQALNQTLKKLYHQVMTAPVETESAGEPPNLVNQFIELRNQGEDRVFDCLNLINNAYASGEFFRSPQALAQIREEAEVKPIWSTVQRLLKSTEQSDAMPMPRVIRTAYLLGMDQVPGGKELLGRFVEKYGIQTYLPTREDLARSIQARFNLGDLAQQQAQGKLSDYLQNPVFSSLPENYASQTFMSGDDRRQILGDVLENWEDTQTALQVPDKKAISKLSKQLSRDYLKGKVTNQEAEALSKLVWALFQNPALRAKYPKINGYLAHVGQKGYEYNWTVNGEMLALLYSLKLVSDVSQPGNGQSRDSVFSKPLDFIPNKKSELLRSSELPKIVTKHFGRKLASLALVGSVALGGAYTLGHFGMVNYLDTVSKVAYRVLNPVDLYGRPPGNLHDFLNGELNDIARIITGTPKAFKPKPTPMVEALQDPVVIEPEIALSFIPEPLEEVDESEYIPRSQPETAPAPAYEPPTGISAEEELRNALEYQRRIDEAVDRAIFEQANRTDDDEDEIPSSALSQSSNQESVEDESEAEIEDEEIAA
jgi:hypothetical protein